LISESGVGRAVASTRQNAGTDKADWAPGGVNDPATTAASCTVTLGMVSAARLSHDRLAAVAGVASCHASGIDASAPPASSLRVISDLRGRDYTQRREEDAA
jgi:hypothetical protein